MSSKTVFRAIVVIITLMSSPCMADKALEFAKVGQFVHLFTNWYWNTDFKDEIKQKYAEGRAAIVAAGGPEKYLQSYDTNVKTLLELPWGEPWAKWSKEQIDKWKAISIIAPDDWISGDGDFGRFYLLIGQEGMRFGYSEPYYINVAGFSLSGELNAINTGLSNIVWLRDTKPELFKTLAPEVQDAIKNIAAYLKKSRDPMGDGLVVDDVNKMSENGKIILKAIRGGKLIQ